ncbi:CD225/dispanin family protein [Gordonia aquimaris]|uniref:CD225/dispanin family protein n=1 Tax=Gordonia aquimaris TaxID=2984863 RepID=A0A9X3D7B4_9ACTN|nr:CD225/dispanin family protein [Gordonia aquimaris]MCX2966190.1 CD225/dispanin family protein [Gordonia aquimaris]
MYPSQSSPSASPRPTMPPPAPQRASTPMPATNVGWAVAAVIFFWPLAFAAFTHSSNVTGLWLSGDHIAAEDASRRAKTLGKVALAIWAVLTVAVIVFYAVVIATALASASSYSYY